MVSFEGDYYQQQQGTVVEKQEEKLQMQAVLEEQLRMMVEALWTAQVASYSVQGIMAVVPFPVVQPVALKQLDTVGTTVVDEVDLANQDEGWAMQDYNCIQRRRKTNKMVNPCATFIF